MSWGPGVTLIVLPVLWMSIVPLDWLFEPPSKANVPFPVLVIVPVLVSVPPREIGLALVRLSWPGLVQVPKIPPWLQLIGPAVLSMVRRRSSHTGDVHLGAGAQHGRA